MLNYYDKSIFSLDIIFEEELGICHFKNIRAILDEVNVSKVNIRIEVE